VYEYGTIESGVVGNVDLQSALLLVFIEADRYVGYLWFSSSSSLERTSGFVSTWSGARP
jgi:hypothetical protein